MPQNRHYKQHSQSIYSTTTTLDADLPQIILKNNILCGKLTFYDILFYTKLSIIDTHTVALKSGITNSSAFIDT